MHILKLPWLNHNEENRKHEVYSLSVSPDGSRLASGGLDGKVRIWSIPDILKFQDTSLERDASCRPLCSMARHNGAVTVVRFSPDGRFLASGSDDKVLLIWEKDEESRPSFGEQNLEHWTVTKRVVAHDNDIQDIAWAPDSSILVSVGLDRSVIIWSGSTFEKLKRFDVHQSTVKGIVFDPANKYFATSSDDRSVRIFRYHKGSELSFSIDCTVLQPFKKSPLTTYFRRLSWSPDGQHIAVPNATNGPVTSVAIINRGSWDSDFSLIGHEAPCEVASFSPVLYEVENHGENVISSVLATGGQDKHLVIWNNTFPRPLGVFQDMTFKTITDLDWTPTGDVLFCSSLDGTISVIIFEKGELGTPVSSEKNDELLNKYGVDKDSMVFPETTDQLILEDKAAEFQKTLSQKHMDRLLQIEQPTLPKPPTLTQQSSSLAPSLNLNASDILSTKDLSPKVIQTSFTEKSKLNKIVLKNGKKRVAPTLISTTSSSNSKIQDRFKDITLTTKKALETHKAELKLSKPGYNLPRIGIQTSVHGYYLKKTSPGDEEEDEGDDIEDFEESDEEELSLEIPKFANSESSIVKLRQKYTETNLLTKTLRKAHDVSLLEVMNYYDYFDEEDDDVTIIKSYLNNEQVFETFVQDTIIAITGEFEKYWVLATNSGSLIFYSSSGRILYPSIELGFNVSYMTSKNSVLSVITDDYILHSYDMNKFKMLHRGISLAPILNYDIPVNDKRIKLTSQVYDIDIQNDITIVILENSGKYTFDSSIKAWLKISDPFHNDCDDHQETGESHLNTPANNSYSVTSDPILKYTQELTSLEHSQTVAKLLGDEENPQIVTALEQLKRDDLYKEVRSCASII